MKNGNGNGNEMIWNEMERKGPKLFFVDKNVIF